MAVRALANSSPGQPARRRWARAQSSLWRGPPDHRPHRANARCYHGPQAVITMIMLDRAGLAPNLPWNLAA
jgi:hypothetical protein